MFKQNLSTGLTTALLGFASSIALAQHGVHSAGATAGAAGGHVASMGRAAGGTAMAGPRVSIRQGPATRPGLATARGPIARQGGETGGGRPSSGGRAVTGRMDEGNWTSAGFFPHGGSGTASHARDQRHHVGYGYLGYAAFPYGYSNFYGGLDLDDNDPNDPNLQPTAGGTAYDNNPGPLQDSGYDATAAYDTARIPYVPGGGSAYAPANDLPRSNGLGHPKVTLIFKDGRQPMMIQNYAMTQTRLFIRDNGTERDIAISDLNVPATMAANDQAGVDFELPVGQ